MLILHYEVQLLAFVLLLGLLSLSALLVLSSAFVDVLEVNDCADNTCSTSNVLLKVSRSLQMFPGGNALRMLKIYQEIHRVIHFGQILLSDDIFCSGDVIS